MNMIQHLTPLLKLSQKKPWLFVLQLSVYLVSAQMVWAVECPQVPTPPSSETLQTLKSEARDRGFLWKISKGGHNSWLYGTLHVGKLNWAIPGPQLMAALKSSQLLALEMDPLDATILQKMASLSTLGAGQIPKPLKPRLKKQLDLVCLPESVMDQLHPVMLFSTLELLHLRKRGLEAGYGAEYMLSNLAHAAGKPVESLETPESQMQTLIGKDSTIKSEEIKDALQQLEKGTDIKTLNQLVDIWDKSKFSQLENYTQWCNCIQTKEQRDLMKRMLNDRNPALAKAIDSLHNTGKIVFAAVGSLHMVGNIGLPTLLKQRGYTVSMVTFQ